MLWGCVGLFSGSILFFGPFRVFPFLGITLSSLLPLDKSRSSNQQILLDPCLNNLGLRSLESRGLVVPRLKASRDTCSLVTSAPWLEDKNHAWPGIGTVNVLYAGWVRSYVQDKQAYSLIGGWAINNDLNLANKKLELRYLSRGLDDGSSVHFWFQGRMPYGRVFNYIHVTPLPTSEVPTAFALDLSQPGKYRCLGSAFKRRQLKVYGCDVPSDVALRNVNMDFGFLRIVGNSAYPSGVPGSSFEILSLQIKK